MPVLIAYSPCQQKKKKRKKKEKEKEQKGSHSKESTLIDWPNSNNYPQRSRQPSQPTLRREGDARLTGASSKKGKCAESPPTFI